MRIVAGKFSDVDLVKSLIANSKTFSEVFRKMGVNNPSGGGYYRQMNIFISKHQVDVSHMNGTAWNRGLSTGKNIGIRIPDIEVLCCPSYVSRRCVRRRLAELTDCTCEQCGISELYNDKPITLHVDHINGVIYDNRVENLRWLCPNCHSQTSNYGSKNAKFKKLPKEVKKNTCVKCKKKCRNKYCSNECSALDKRTIERPRVEDLIAQVSEQSHVKVGLRYGVSGNTIKKWILSGSKKCGRADSNSQA